MKVGSPIEIRLKARPGTGFSWSPKKSAGTLSAMESIRGEAMPGGWETQRFRFLANRGGTYRVTFSYDQPWPGGVKAAQSKTFIITVR